MPCQLSVSVVTPEDSAWGVLELKLLVDGRDLVAEVFDPGPAKDPDGLLGPDSPLLPTGEPREVRLAEADCTEGCCGAIYVRVRADGDQVVWDAWRNPDDEELSLPEVRFDAAQYEAELARADGDRSWEWPGRTVARLLNAKLRAEPAVLAQWNSDLAFVNSWPHERAQVVVSFFSPPIQVVRDESSAGRRIDWRQFLLRVPVTNESAETQAEHIITRMRAEDPRAEAEVCGG